MFEGNPTSRVEATFVGPPPIRRVAEAAGVSDVSVDGGTIRCLVHGSFQPFLEALRGHEVIALWSVRAFAPIDPDPSKPVA
jgi:hypothetical protein